MCELDDLFVEPDSMGLGVGRLLVEDVAARAATEGANRVMVTANPRALGFYERLGFRITGEASTRFAPAPRMTLDLPAPGQRTVEVGRHCGALAQVDVLSSEG